MSIQRQLNSSAISLADKAATPEQIKAVQAQILRGMQDGSLQSYVGVPLLSDLTKRLGQIQNAQAASQAMLNQPPIGAQVVQQAQQGIDSVPTNLPQQGFAPGGIVAFADGGFPEDDPEYDPSKSDPAEIGGLSNEERNLLAGFQSGPATSAEQGITGIGSGSDEDEDEESPEEPAEGFPAEMSAPQSEGIIAVSSKGKGKGPSTFHTALGFVMPHEGGYSEDKSDKGGPTKYGITKSTLEDYVGHSVSKKELKNVTPELAARIYKEKFWDAIGADRLDPRTAVVAFDAAVQHGPEYARQLVNTTRGDINAMLSNRMKYYDNIIKNNPSQAKFAAGWGNRLNDLSNFVSTMGGQRRYVDDNFDDMSARMAEGGIACLAAGGAVKHFANTGAVEDDFKQFEPGAGNNNFLSSIWKGISESPFGKSVSDAYYDIPRWVEDNVVRSAGTAAAAEMGQPSMLPQYNTQPPIDTTPYVPSAHDLAPPASAASDPNKPRLTPAGDYIALKEWEQENGGPSFLEMYPNMGTPSSGIAPTAETAPTAPATQDQSSSWIDRFGKNISQNEADLAQQKALSPWLALGAAGLGMIGKSPFFAANLGAGAAQGMGTYENLKKMEMAQEQGITNALSAGARADLLEKSRQDRINELKMYHQETVDARNRQIDANLELAKYKLGLQNSPNSPAALQAKARMLEAGKDIAAGWPSSPEYAAATQALKGMDPTSVKAQTTLENFHTKYMARVAKYYTMMPGMASDIPKSTDK